jgi:hypothetical protein
MARARIALLLSLPLSACGMLLAHQLTWRVAAHDHDSEVAHGYLRYGAIFVALAVAVVVVAATRQLVRTVGGGSLARAPSAVMFAVLPIVGFVFQEHLEHLVASRELEVTFFLSPPFLIGVALQLPFALAALLVARLILAGIRTVATVVREVATAPWLRPVAVSLVPIPSLVDLPQRRVLSFPRAGRAPPAFH